MDMRNDEGFANLIYDYFVVRFHFQYYKYGDSLPKIDALCPVSYTHLDVYKRQDFMAHAA